MAGIWTRNYYNFLTAAILGDTTLTSTTQPTDYTPPIMLHRGNGQWVNAYSEAGGTTITQTNDSQHIFRDPFYIGKGNARLITQDDPDLAQCVGIALGSGTTAATYEDYKLDNLITSGLALVSAAGTLATPSTYDNVTHHYKSERSYTINNTSASPITITEFGLYTPLRYSTIAYGVMVYREVLDTPVTLASGESMIVKFTRDAEVYNYTPY